MVSVRNTVVSFVPPRYTNLYLGLPCRSVGLYDFYWHGTSVAFKQDDGFDWHGAKPGRTSAFQAGVSECGLYRHGACLYLRFPCRSLVGTSDVQAGVWLVPARCMFVPQISMQESGLYFGCPGRSVVLYRHGVCLYVEFQCRCVVCASTVRFCIDLQAGNRFPPRIPIGLYHRVRMCTSDQLEEMRFVPAQYNVVPRIYTQESVCTRCRRTTIILLFN